MTKAEKEKQKEKQKKLRAYKKFLNVRYLDQLPQGILKKFGVETKNIEEAIKFLEGLNIDLLETLQQSPAQKAQLPD